jgi:hypothetical protein
MNLNEAVHKGIIIPSATDENSTFEADFSITNPNEQTAKFKYIIYYQNESYKHLEYTSDFLGKKTYNPLSGNNFYGCWEGENTQFKTTQEIPPNQETSINEKIRIIGNPRNERKYFGPRTKKKAPSQERINEVVQDIDENNEWCNLVAKKAEENGFTIHKQMYMDALWMIDKERKKGPIVENHRWKRNPRAGNYKFMLVVLTEEAYSKLPYFIKDIHVPDSSSGKFINPYFFFKHNDTLSRNGIWVNESHKVLNVKASYCMNKGVYVDMLHYQDVDSDESNFNNYCGRSDELYENAHFQQHFHAHLSGHRLRNIPIARDVITDYTFDEFERNQAHYSADSSLLTDDYVRTTNCPCATVGYDTSSQCLFVKNPGNTKRPSVKENVGVKARIGFSYGKYTATIKFPKLINEENVWNGITAAFWLIYQSDDEWNYRDICNSGYIPRGSDVNDKRPRTSYSEIDIEIVKTSRIWSTNPKDMKKENEYPAENNNLIVTCTNWDLACRDPEDFFGGDQEIEFEGQEFRLRRWDETYKAVTLKTENPHNETVGDKFYYQIDWQPDRIIWRIGTDRNNLKVVGYMDSTVTNIPNNQMVPIISQEFHYGEWWPYSPFQQNFIPYPAQDIVGEIYEIEVE